MRFCSYVTAIAAAAALCGTALAQDIAPTPPPAGAANAAPAELLPALISHSRRLARIENGRLVGEGGDFLRALGARAQFVMIGEDHGNAGIADFATAYWADLNAAGFNYAAVESDPWVARALERELRAGGVEGWTAFLAPRGGAVGAPFFSWAPEARWADAIVRGARRGRTETLWGLDQVFLGAAPWLLREIATQARSNAARTMAGQFAEEARGDLNWLGRVDPARLTALRAALADRRDAPHARLVDAMIESRAIYGPFSGAGGEANLANDARERLMRRLFLEHYQRAERADGAAPRVMLKFGASHAYRGASMTWVQGLGGFVSEFAAARGTETLTVLALCGPGSFTASYQGPPTRCEEARYARDWAFMTPHLDPNAISVFDLRAWRLRPRRWAHLPAEVQRAIGSFDVLVFMPASPASEWLPGLAAPAMPGN